MPHVTDLGHRKLCPTKSETEIIGFNNNVCSSQKANNQGVLFLHRMEPKCPNPGDKLQVAHLNSEVQDIHVPVHTLLRIVEVEHNLDGYFLFEPRHMIYSLSKGD